MPDRGIQEEVSDSIFRSFLICSLESELASQLNRWLEAVPETYSGVQGARIIIAP